MLVTRRHFLVLSAAALASCARSTAPETGAQNQTQTQAQVVSLFSSNRVIAAGIPQRLPFGVVDNGLVLPSDAVLPVRVLRDGELLSETELASHVIRHDHSPGTGDEPHLHADLQRYFALRTTLPDPGIYDLEITIGDEVAMLPVQAFDRSEIRVLLPGDRFPILQTPTVADGRGVDPLCTHIDTPCPLHERTAAEILQDGRPLALLVATPAFCSTAYCGPVLDTVLDTLAARTTANATDPIGFVHVEPYANPREGQGLSDPGLRLAPSLAELGLDFEPSLFLVDSSGVLVDRIDNVFDTAELEEALAQLS